MAAVAPSADQAVDMLQKMSLDSRASAIEVPNSTQLSVDTINTSSGVRSDQSTTPLLPDITDPTVCYHPNSYQAGCYYGGYDGSDWDIVRFMSPDMTAYGEGAPLMYHPGYSYSHYPPYSPAAASMVPTLAHDGQLYGAQQYQYPTPYFQSMAATSGTLTNTAAPTKGELAASSPSDQAPLPVDSSNSKSSGIATGGGAKGNNGSLNSRPGYPNSTYNLNSMPGGILASSFQDPKYTFDGLHSPIPWLENTYYSDGQPRHLVTSSSMTTTIPNVNSLPPYRNQGLRSSLGLHHPRPLAGLNPAAGYMNRMYPNRLYSQYGSTYRSGVGYGSSDYASRTNGRGWMAVDAKYKPRGRANAMYVYGGESIDGLNELNRGPRTKSSKNTKGITQVTLAVKGQSIPSAGAVENEKSATTPDREQYNRQNFPEEYSDAKFFVIKSYSEDDIHKSIKYSTWSSTENGNKKLDAAFQEAQQKPGSCPVFLFFSVNTSGQFVGVAEMVGAVDFSKNVEYWQQDKWIGCFPVKWHIIKDVPNSVLKHIILENNENKPVTNSRDTQEVKLDQGLKILKIFKDHACTQCVLDDFDFYEERQKRIQEKKGKLRQFQKQAQVWEGKPADEATQDKNQSSQELVSDSPEGQSPPGSNGDLKSTENSSLPTSGDGVKPAKPAASIVDKKQVANKAANGF